MRRLLLLTLLAGCGPPAPTGASVAMPGAPPDAHFAPAADEPPAPVVQLVNPCVLDEKGSVFCWGNAGGGPKLRRVAQDVERLVHIGDQTCWRRNDGAFRCPRPCASCAGVLQQKGVVDISGDLVLFDDGRVVKTSHISGEEGDELRAARPGAARAPRENEREKATTDVVARALGERPSLTSSEPPPWNRRADAHIGMHHAHAANGGRTPALVPR